MDKLIESFEKVYHHKKKLRVFYSPGRINIIGEHIDYNGGLVFPAAISIGTYGVVSPRSDQTIRMFSNNYNQEGILTIDMNDLKFNEKHGWSNYAKGILEHLIKRGYTLPFGFDLFVEGNLPTASGLSSSASLEVLVSFIANELYDLHLNRVDMALLSQEVENEYMGMQCGIMDQLIIACGIKDKALLMNTKTLEMEESNAQFPGYQWVVMGTNYQRKTTDSKYNIRVLECKKGFSMLKKIYNIEYLCDLSVLDLPNIKNIIKDDTIYRRIKHVVTEQKRTLDSKIAMSTLDVFSFAKLLNQSHESLKNDYEVTGIHLDTLVDAARNNGAIGARVTGAGFGGCAIALVENDKVEKMKKQVGQIYAKETGLNAKFFDVTFEDGVHEVK